ncbi:MAG: hypothetical protein QOD76_1342 [Solirubrobacteraceae bacterium]|nr:hypothetical protein [Solirubrobacteraceae bacterium]
MGDEVSSAYVHALDAVSALGTLVGPARAHTLAVTAMLAGDLDSDRLPAVLSLITPGGRAAAHR